MLVKVSDVLVDLGINLMESALRKLAKLGDA
jgi:hypothetical protein